jgi:hypothetical protein
MPTIQSAKIKLKKIFTEILYGGKYILLLFCIPSLYSFNYSESLGGSVSKLQKRVHSTRSRKW